MDRSKSSISRDDCCCGLRQGVGMLWMGWGPRVCTTPSMGTKQAHVGPRALLLPALAVVVVDERRMRLSDTVQWCGLLCVLLPPQMVGDMTVRSDIPGDKGYGTYGAYPGATALPSRPQPRPVLVPLTHRRPPLVFGRHLQHRLISATRTLHAGSHCKSPTSASSNSSTRASSAACSVKVPRLGRARRRCVRFRAGQARDHSAAGCAVYGLRNSPWEWARVKGARRSGGGDIAVSGSWRFYAPSRGTGRARALGRGDASHLRVTR